DHSQRCDARTVVMSRVYQFQPGVAVAPPGPMPASPSLLPSPADGLVRRVEELRDRFPFSFRVARLLYRKFLK
ncbi:hypothetical protein QN347_19875, partial [Sphingomonas sp. 10B4]|nr:hypothetical protein [Sphingomonas sp. 10B4]